MSQLIEVCLIKEGYGLRPAFKIAHSISLLIEFPQILKRREKDEMNYLIIHLKCRLQAITNLIDKLNNKFIPSYKIKLIEEKALKKKLSQFIDYGLRPASTMEFHF